MFALPAQDVAHRCKNPCIIRQAATRDFQLRQCPLGIAECVVEMPAAGKVRFGRARLELARSLQSGLRGGKAARHVIARI